MIDATAQGCANVDVAHPPPFPGRIIKANSAGGGGCSMLRKHINNIILY
jgi:hypothetical protein